MLQMRRKAAYEEDYGLGPAEAEERGSRLEGCGVNVNVASLAALGVRTSARRTPRPHPCTTGIGLQVSPPRNYCPIGLLFAVNSYE